MCKHKNCNRRWALFSDWNKTVGALVLCSVVKRVNIFTVMISISFMSTLSRQKPLIVCYFFFTQNLTLLFNHLSTINSTSALSTLKICLSVSFNYSHDVRLFSPFRTVRLRFVFVFVFLFLFKWKKKSMTVYSYFIGTWKIIFPSVPLRSSFDVSFHLEILPT